MRVDFLHAILHLIWNICPEPETSWYVHLISNEWCHILINNELSNILLLPCSRASSELVISFLQHALIWHFHISQHLCLIRSDNAGIDIWTRTKVIKYSGWYSSLHQRQSIFSLLKKIKRVDNAYITYKLTSMFAFHSLSKTAIAAKLPDPIVTYGSLSVDPWGWTVNKCAPVESTPPSTRAAPMWPWYLKAYVGKVIQASTRSWHLPEKHLLQHGHCCDDMRLPTSLQGVQFHVWRN